MELVYKLIMILSSVTIFLYCLMRSICFVNIFFVNIKIISVIIIQVPFQQQSIYNN